MVGGIEMHNIKSPCLGCEFRHTKCHQDCEVFKEYRSKIDAANEAKTEEYQKSKAIKKPYSKNIGTKRR